MPILREIPITLTAQEIIAAHGQRRIRPELLQDAEKAISLGQTLWQPMAVYDWFDVRTVTEQDVYVGAPDRPQGEVVLHVGPKADLLHGAERILASVVTIGPALERQVHALQAAGKILMSYLLDSAGVVALGAVGEAIRCLAEESASELDWGVSPSLSPGSLVGWSLRGQRDLCALLPTDTVGVRLNAHCVLEPHKSASGIIGLGPNYASAKVGSVCKYCALKKTCWRRREDPS